MSHQTGIRPNKRLESFFNESRKGNTRCIKIRILNEQLELDGSVPCKKSFEEDHTASVKSLLKEKECCYMLVRTESKFSNGDYKWIFIMYTPDAAPVKEKMLYAATKSTLKQNMIGSDFISEEIHGTRLDDITHEGYKIHLNAANASAPLTDAEKVKNEIKKNEKSYALSAKAETLPGISFPVDSQVSSAFRELKEKKINYVELVIDSGMETIKLGQAKNLDITKISKLSFKEPRYHFILYPHKHENKSITSIVFIYTMPGYSCPVKDRMMYSSCKNPLVSYFESKYDTIDKKLEEESLLCLSHDYLMNELHPPVVQAVKAFAKPARPGRR